jgi:hypothetical protein
VQWERLKSDQVPGDDVLAAATVYEEAGPVIAGGRWYVLPEGVYHRNAEGVVQMAVVSADTLAGPTFREVPAGA